MMFETILRSPDWVMVQSERGEWKAAGSPGAARREDVVVETALEGDRLAVYLTADSTPVRLIRLRWQFSQPMKGTFLGDAWERGYGDMGWRNMIPYRAMPWFFLAQRENVTAGYGVRVRPGALCFWQADSAGVSLWLDVRSGGVGVVLSGRRLLAAQVVFRTYEGVSAYEASRRFCQALCDDPIFPPHPVYGSNNWYYAYGHSSQQEILADTDYLMALTGGLDNRPYMVVDDCWQKYRSDDYIGGPWVSNEKFPDMAGLAADITAKGARPGLWMRLLLDRSESIPAQWRLANGSLDPSHPEVLAHMQEDIRRVCGWGYRLIKHDFSTFDIFGRWGPQMLPLMAADGWRFHDQSRTSAEIVTSLYRAILEAAAPTGTLILGCNTVGHLGAGLMHLNRTGDDTSGLLWERTARLGVNTLAFRMSHHRTFYDVDADCLGITEHIPWELNRQWGQLLAKSGTPFFVSAKPGVLTAEQEKELAGFFREASEQAHIAQPLDWQETSLPQTWQVGTEQLSYNWYEDTGLRSVRASGAIWEQIDGERYF
ncbi:MAG: alpha-galactosidase [Clostridiales bacterium]|nr:alpha-galactosidase [Clostridiales bacterium]